MTSIDHGIAHAWPACALGGWAAAWIAGRCSPDDVIDTLASSADLHVLDDRSGIGDTHQTAIPALLGLLRGARRLSVRLPMAGDPQGLPPDDATRLALSAGEVLLVDDGGTTPLALIPTEHDGSCRWTVMRYRADVVGGSSTGTGEVEYELRQAVTSATDLISRIGGRATNAPSDLRGTVATLTQSHLVELPPHDDPRVTRMVETAAQIEAIATIAGGSGTSFGATAGQWSAGDDELRRLVVLTHAARAAAVDRVITEFLGRPW